MGAAPLLPAAEPRTGPRLRPPAPRNAALRGGHQRGRDLAHHPGGQVRRGQRALQDKALRQAHRSVGLQRRLDFQGTVSYNKKVGFKEIMTDFSWEEAQ